jgi:hypothetical protein
VLVGPLHQGTENLVKVSSTVSQLVFDRRRHCRIDRSFDQAVAIKVARSACAESFHRLTISVG